MIGERERARTDILERNKFEEGGARMKNKWSTRRIRIWLPVILIGLVILPVFASAEEAVQRWDLINPEGVIKLEPMKINAHPSTLEGKTVVLRGNSKHNSDNFLNRIAELLQKEVKGIKIIKAWEVAPETYAISQNPDVAKQFAEKIASLKPDLVIASQCD